MCLERVALSNHSCGQEWTKPFLLQIPSTGANRNSSLSALWGGTLLLPSSGAARTAPQASQRQCLVGLGARDSSAPLSLFVSATCASSSRMGLWLT